MKKCKSKTKAKPHKVTVPLYPFDLENNETVNLTENQLITTNNCLAPHIPSPMGPQSRSDPSYRFDGKSADTKRFNYLFRHFVINKKICLEDEIRELNFIQLIGILKREFLREEDRVISQWREGLHDAFETGKQQKNLEHWHIQIWKVIELFKNCQVSRPGDAASKQAPFPYMNLLQADDNIFAWRTPGPQDLTWMYYVLGWKMEFVFAISNLFMPVGAEQAMRKFWKYAKESIFETLAESPLRDFQDWWSLVRADLEGLPSSKPGKTGQSENDEVPNDLITLAVVTQDFHVSRKTVKIDIHDEKIKSYRKSKKGMHYVSKAKVGQIYTLK